MAKSNKTTPKTRLLITCEHGGREVPKPYQSRFRGAKETLQSHRGWDPGAADLAAHLAQHMRAQAFTCATTRLFIELNRSLPHPSLFSEFTRELPLVERQAIILQHYLPYRWSVEKWIDRRTSCGERVLHLSIHTFTPELDGVVRDADIGLLFDPASPWETGFCHAWSHRLKTDRPELRVRDNYPYLGTDDGFTTYLRYRFPRNYAGIEVEVNQSWPLGKKSEWQALQEALAKTLAIAAR